MMGPFCKNEPHDPDIEKMVDRLERADDLDIPAWLPERSVQVWEDVKPHVTKTPAK